jgi:uncharacterized MnhB-related membrane protein
MNLLLVAAAVVAALMASRSARLLSSALWLAAVSALLSVVFFGLGARQVAVIELSVGAGLVTLLFIFAINLAGESSRPPAAVVPSWLAAVVAALVPVLLAALAVFEAVAAPVEANIGFSAMLWQQRGLDVLVQIVLIFAGVLGLLGLLAEVEAPLRGPAAKEMAARRDQELLAMENIARREEISV